MKLSIWVTRSCNMACDYCYEQDNLRDDIFINEYEYIEKCIDFINTTCRKTNSNKLFIKFFGGEPLLKYPFIYKFIKKLDNEILPGIRIFYSITTNGTLMTNEIIAWFKDNDIECALSIDGNKSVYESNRHYKNGKSSWKTVDELIPKVVDNGLKLSARMTYNSKTVDSLYSSLMYLINRGFTVLKAIPDYFDDNWTDNQIPILEEQIRLIYKFKYENQHIRINLDDDDLFIGRKGCAGGYSMFSVDRNGDIYPCTYIVGTPKFIIGNIFDNCEIPLNYTDGTQIHRKGCNGCKYYKCCKSSGCLYGNYKLSGRFDKVNNFFCSYRKILYSIKERGV